MKSMDYKSKYYFFDIDGTLTRYKATVRPENFLHKNFLFPIIRDMMMERGMERQDAEDGILRVMKEVPFWDYTDFISEFRLPITEAYERMWEWHRINMEPYQDAVDMVKMLSEAGRTLFIISNNPYFGCCMKLKVCGLGDEFGSPFFRQIFSTDKLRGCKGEPGVWLRAVDQIPDDRAAMAVVGDNPVEDGELPRSLGVGEIIILQRGQIQRGIDSGNL